MRSSRPPVRVVRLGKVFPNAAFFRSQDLRVGSCCDRIDQVQPGDLFVVRESNGTNRIGLRQASAGLAFSDVSDLSRSVEDAVAAMRRGAVGLLVERLLPIDAPQCVVPSIEPAYARLCHRLAGNPSRSLPTVGVAGSNGKTTTALLIASVFKAAGVRTGYTTTLRNSDSVQPETPPRPMSARSSASHPRDLAEWMSRMKAAECRAAVVECPTSSLAAHTFAGVRFDVAVLTDLRRDFLDSRPTLREDTRAKLRLLRQLAADGVVIANADDHGSTRLFRGLERPVLTVGMNCEADVTATLVERTIGEQTFMISYGEESVPVRTRIIGDQHIHHALQAAAVGLFAGFDLPTIARGIEAVEWLPGRMERIECGQSFGVFVDEASSPDRLAVTLHALRSASKGRLICVTGIDGALDPSLRPLIGRVVERSADVAVLTSDNPRRELPRGIIHDLLDGCEHPGRPHVIPDRELAIQVAIQHAKPGDVVLIAGKGDRTGQVIGRQAIEHDDREAARNALYEAARDAGPILLPFPGVGSKTVV